MDERAEYLETKPEVQNEHPDERPEHGQLGPERRRAIDRLPVGTLGKEQRDGHEQGRQHDPVLLGCERHGIGERHEPHADPLRAKAPQVGEGPEQHEESHQGIASAHRVRYGLHVDRVRREDGAAKEGEERCRAERSQEDRHEGGVGGVKPHVERMKGKGASRPHAPVEGIRERRHRPIRRSSRWHSAPIKEK